MCSNHTGGSKLVVVEWLLRCIWDADFAGSSPANQIVLTMLDKLINFGDKLNAKIVYQLKIRRNKDGKRMVYIMLDGRLNDKHYVYYTRQLSLKNAMEKEDELIAEMVAAIFNED